MGCVMWYHCKVIVLVFGKVMGMGFWVVLGNGFILWHLFRHDRVRVHLTLLSDFMKTWYLAYF